jgi:hypothetical protein
VLEVVPKVTGKHKKATGETTKQPGKQRTPVALAGPTDAELELNELDDFSTGSLFIKCNGKSMWCDEIVDAALAKIRVEKAKKGGDSGAQGDSGDEEAGHSQGHRLAWGSFFFEYLSTSDLATVMGHILSVLKVMGIA